MKKSLIALAALATVGAAQAQSSVTVYGSFDTSYNSLSYDNVAGRTRAADQLDRKGINVVGAGALTSNRLGFRGSEDLGGGLKANFNLEYGFFGNLAGDTQISTPYATTTDGASSTVAANTNLARNDASAAGGTIQTRTSRIGLESAKLGTVNVGYGLTGLFATVTGHSPLPGNNFIGDVAYTSDATSSADSRIITGAVRMSGVQYTTPTFNGLRATVDYGAGKNVSNDLATADTRTSNTGLTLNYRVGALETAATVHNLKVDAATAANQINNVDFTAVSARYNINSNLAVNALYAKRKTTGLAGAQVDKNDVQQVGVRYTMGKSALVAQYGEGEGEGTSATNARRDRKGYQVGAIYNLSKRTNAYVLYGQQEAKYVDAQSSSPAGDAGTKEKISGYAVGLRHSF